MKILVTGFEPFGGETVNPAWEIAQGLPQTIAGAQIVARQIPCVFGQSIQTLVQAMEEEKPDLVLCLGQAGGRSAVCPERVAINLSDARIPDNAGAQPIDEPIMAEGENAYFSNLPVKAMAQAVRQAGVPAQVSNTAGTYVCNHLMYGLLYHIHKSFPHVRGGFVHVPYLTEQVVDKPNVPSLSLEQMIRAVSAALEACVLHAQDLASAEGAEH